MSALDPFYLVREEVQDSVVKLQVTLGRWEQLPSSAAERIVLHKELLSGCESIEWQVNELDRAIGVAERDPARFSVDSAEIERRKKWTASTRSQVQSIVEKLSVVVEKNTEASNGQISRRELMRLENQYQPTSNHGVDDVYESDRQALILKEQDEDLDDLSATVERLGDVGLSIHEELSVQGHLMDELTNDMDSTANRLDFVQKRIAGVLKKAGWKGQVMTIVFLVVLLLILTLLVFSAAFRRPLLETTQSSEDGEVSNHPSGLNWDSGSSRKLSFLGRALLQIYGTQL
uniref:t-SNARE coiled-coil homology domain-containing protein n=1 Tax=Physcomitrium patens TaxID=3218 RepID=A0A7I4BBV5_PHYPA